MYIVTTTEPDEIFVEFLRCQLTDPRSRHTNTSDTFNGDGSAKTFTLTKKGVRCIKSATVGGAAQTKYLAFTYDLKDGDTYGTVTFVAAPAVGVGNVVINYDYGTTSWIFPDGPREDLSATSYPRIGVITIDNSGNPTSFSEDDTWDNIRFQLEVQVHKDNTLTYGGNSLTGKALERAIAKDVRTAIKTNWRTTIAFANLRGPKKFNDFDKPFDDDHQLFARLLDYGFEGENIGDSDY